MRPTRQIVTLATLLCLGFGGAQAGTVERFTSFFAFGDSLTDPGNVFAATGGTLPPSPPYFEGRFSNGPVWAEAVAGGFASRGLATGNFAFGFANAVANGDSVPDAELQVGLFLSTVPAAALGDRPLAALWFGANDVFDVVDNLLPTDPLTVVTTAAANAAKKIAEIAATLSVARGITDFVLFTLPDLGRTPSYALTDPAIVDNAAPGFYTPDRADEATAGAEAFNAEIALQIAGLRALGLNVIEIDMKGLFDRLIDTPQDFGVSDATLPCFIIGISLCTPEALAEKVFFDHVHPTATIHQAIADVVLEQVAPVPLPLTAGLLGSGLAGLALVARRRRA